MDETVAPTRQSAAAASLGAALFAAGHLVLLRELTVISGGSELAAAAGLGAALGWLAVGALLGSRLAARLGSARPAWLLAFLPALFGAQLWAARSAGLLLATPSGAGLLPWQLGLAAAALTAPLGLACGLLVPLLARGAGSGARLWPAVGAGLAAGAAGFALTAALGWGQVRTAAALAGVFICMLSALLGPRMGRRGKLALAGWTLAAAAGALAMGATPLGGRWQLATASRGGLLGEEVEALAERESTSGSLVVLRGEGEALTVCVGGAVRARYPDPRARDDALFACGQAWSLARVLVVGGGRPELVRELLARGAGRIDVVEPDRALDAVLDPHLADQDRAALAHPGVRRHYGSVRRFLRGNRGYDLVILSPPPPRGAVSARFYSKEFLGELAARLARRGVLVVVAPRGGGADFLARIYAVLRELGGVRLAGKAKLVGLPAVYPAGHHRFAAARALDPVEEISEALERYRHHRAPGGAEPLPPDAEALARVLNLRGARELTGRLEKRWEARYVAPESVQGPRIHLEYLAGSMEKTAPRSAAALKLVTRTPLWGPFAALGLFFIVGGLLARRSRGTVPGRFALCSAAFMNGLVGLGALGLSAAIYGAASGALAGALPLLLAALSAGLGLGASLAGRLEAPAARRSSRRALGAVQFGFVLVLLAGCQAVRLPAGSGWNDLAHGLGLAALGLLAGLELGVLARCLEERAEADRAARSAGALIGSAGLGALLAAVLAVSFLFDALGPAAVFLFLVAAKVVMFGLVLAGRGMGRRPTAILRKK